MIDIRNYEEVHKELSIEQDSTILIEQYEIYDGITLLLNAVDPQMLEVEEMLEKEYAKQGDTNDFFLNFALWQLRRYTQGEHGNFQFGRGTGGTKGRQFKERAGEDFPSKAFISFHGNSPNKTFASQIIVIRNSLLHVADHLMDMDVHFAYNNLPSIYEPKKK